MGAEIAEGEGDPFHFSKGLTFLVLQQNRYKRHHTYAVADILHMWRLRGGHSPLATTDKKHQENTAERNNTLLEASHLLFHISIFLAFVKLAKLCEHICKYMKT